jgi:1-acyl-sn-glycerol-3-phosphate acyltransferase
VLLASNHLNAWDTVLIPVAAIRPVQFLTKSSYFEKSGPLGAFLKWFFTNIGAVPVLRAAGSEAQAALAAGSSILSAGSVFAVFPEGTRSRDGRLYKGRGGAAWMALETGAAVVPVGLIGTGDMRVFGWLRRGSARPEVRFGTPLRLSDLADKPGGVARRIATERIMDAIAELTGQERADEFNATSSDASTS